MDINKDKRKKTGKIFLQCVLGVILLMNLAVICLGHIKGPEALKDVPYALLSMDGGSMEPKYHHGDGVLVWQAPYESLKEGDVIVFLQAGELITHQIISIKDGVITAKGSANDVEDEPVTEDNYRAKVLLRIPGMANLQAVYENPVAFIVFAVLLGLLIFGKDIFNRIYTKIS